MGFDWEEGIPPQGRQPTTPLARFGVPDPEFRLHRDHPAEGQLPWILDAVDRYGRARFIADRRAGNRLCRRLRDLLPPGYQAQIEEPAPDAVSLAGRYRWRRRQARLTISRVGGPDHRPRFEDPHRRALGTRNRSEPSAEAPPAGASAEPAPRQAANAETGRQPGPLRRGGPSADATAGLRLCGPPVGLNPGQRGLVAGVPAGSGGSGPRAAGSAICPPSCYPSSRPEGRFGRFGPSTPASRC